MRVSTTSHLIKKLDLTHIPNLPSHLMKHLTLIHNLPKIEMRIPSLSRTDPVRVLGQEFGDDPDGVWGDHGTTGAGDDVGEQGDEEL